MSNIKIQQSMLNLVNILLRLKEALDEPKCNILTIDAIIRHFEYETDPMLCDYFLII